MDATALISRLAPVPDVLEALLSGLSDAEWRFRPPEGGWSLLEILGHLVAEETEDFGARLSSTLEDHARPWAPLDPEGAVVARSMNAADPLATLRTFREERGRTVAWLLRLRDPRWDATHVAPRPPPLRAGDLLASWVAHDARHLAQIARRLHALAARAGSPYDVGYAG